MIQDDPRALSIETPPGKAPMRRALRREVRLACQVVRERDFRLVSELCLDLSPKGMLVATTAPILTGEELVVSFRAPRSGLWIDQVATVVRVVHGRRPEDSGRGLGLCFSAISAADRERLSRLLRDLPLTSRARPWARA
ncbi:MAG: PilZ domain-containing protein [Byssovorax sp.]